MQPDATGHRHRHANSEQRTAKIAVDDAVLLHKFSSEISVDKFLAGIPFPQSQSLFVCVSVCVS